jgi:hypothetical protein
VLPPCGVAFFNSFDLAAGILDHLHRFLLRWRLAK